jgi:hypothetical protein
MCLTFLAAWHECGNCFCKWILTLRMRSRDVCTDWEWLMGCEVPTGVVTKASFFGIQRKKRSAWYLLHAAFLLDFFHPENGSDIPPKRRLTFTGLHDVMSQKAGHGSRAVWSMYSLRSFGSRDRGFESHRRHECLVYVWVCVYSLFVLTCVQVESLRRADHPSKESYRLWKWSRN